MKRYPLLAWIGFVLVAILSAGAIALMFVPLPGHTTTPDQMLSDIFYILNAPTVALVGAFVAANRRENPNGWVMIVVGLALAISAFLNNYTEIAFWTGTATLGGAMLAAWISWWVWVTPYLGLVLILQLFPTGKFLSRRWRWIAYGSMILLVGAMIVFAFSSPIEAPTAHGTVRLANPIGLYELNNVQTPLLFITLNLPTVAALCSLILRFVRARGVERQQMKWLFYSACLFIIVQISSSLIASELIQDLTNLLGLALPVAIGIAILRYRLYAIDILIRRTLTYALVTGTLLLAFFGSIIILQQVFAILVGSQESQRPPPRRRWLGKRVKLA